MKKFIVILLSSVLSLCLIACSPQDIPVKVNGEEKFISQKAFNLLSKTNEPTVKVAILSDDQATYEVVHQQITYKIFESKAGAIVYFNNGDITQYALTETETETLKNELKKQP